MAVSYLKKEKGQSLVEFAFIIPVLILILMGVFDFGRAFYAYNAISNAAREGARYGTICPYDTPQKQCRDSDGFPPYDEPDTIEGRAVAQVFILDQDQFRVRVRFPDPERIDDQFCVDNPYDPTCLNSDPTTGDPIEVTVIYRFYALTPLIDRIWGGGPLPLRSKALMFIE
ncbi:MAG: TadE/TadG family type IV pilus assembly protein [Anaerolineae bacterium]